MNYTSLFYWLTVADNAKTMFVVFILIFTAIAVVSTAAFFLNMDDDSESEENRKTATHWMWWSFPFAIIFWSLFIFTPSKKDALLIVAGGQTLNYLTNDSTAKQIPHELTTFVVSELKNMASDAKVNLNINNQKEKILNEAKNMTGLELIERIKSDTAFAKIISQK